MGFVALPIFQVQSAWTFSGRAVDIVDDIKVGANKSASDEVQRTDLDAVSSRRDSCEIYTDRTATLTRTLCNIKERIKDYLQYVMYVGLAAATIFLIRNGFKIVTSPDREKQMGLFKKNLLYIVIWVFLLIGFYYVIDLFVSVVNLIAE